MDIASTLQSGLVDDADEDTYTQLLSLKDVWDERESQCTNKDPAFHQWLQAPYTKIVKDTKLRSVQQLAGLGHHHSPLLHNCC